MPRKKVVQQKVFPYHITARYMNKEWFSLPMNDLWNIMSNRLTYLSWVYEVEIYSFVLMQNHFHLIAKTPRSNISLAMNNFMKETSREMNQRTKRINKAYGSRHFKCILGNYHYYLNAYKYVYNNPVRAGLVSFCEEYPYSSLSFKLGFTKASFPIACDDTLFDSLDATLSWLNQTPASDDLELMKYCLSKTVFELPSDQRTRKPSHLERELI
jgi:REP element-mobilizing transposase RayT